MAYTGSPTKTRINLTIEKDLKAEVEKKAKDEDRSFNNLVVRAIKEYLQNHPNSTME